MAKAYSDDFRQKVLQALALDGFKKSEVSQLFNISRNTIDLWLKRKAATGDVQAKQRQLRVRFRNHGLGKVSPLCEDTQ
jgi:transposase